MPRRSSKLTAAEARLARQWPGLSRHRPLSSFPRKALEQGAKVEAEHVGDYLPLARRIAADHLVEDPRYYEKIKRYGLSFGKHKKGDPTRGNLQVLAHEIALHDARGDKTLHRFEATSIPHLRRLIAAGYLAPAPGYPRGHWLVTGQAQMALLGI